MDIKLKESNQTEQFEQFRQPNQSRPLFVWLSFFIGINIVASFIAMAFANYEYYHLKEIVALLRSDVKSTQIFEHTISTKFNNLLRSIINQDNGGFSEEDSLYSLEREGENLIYYATNLKTGKIVKNSDYDFAISDTGPASIPEGYNYYLYSNGRKTVAVRDGKVVDLHSRNFIFLDLKEEVYITITSSSDTKTMVLEHAVEEDIEDSSINLSKNSSELNYHILLAVKEDLVEGPYGDSGLYRLEKYTHTFKWIFGGVVFIFLFGLGFLIFSLNHRPLKRKFDKKLAKFSGWFWFELKAVISALAFLLLIYVASKNALYFGFGFGDVIFSLFVMAACCWWIYLIVIDLLVNRRSSLTHNMISSCIEKYHIVERKKPFQKAMILRIFILLAVEILLILLVGIFSIVMFIDNQIVLIFPIFAFIITGIYLIYRYLRRYMNTINDIGAVVDQIESIKNGDMVTKIFLHPDRDLYFVAENLNRIQEGINQAVEERIRSERMKIELITNVSHDLKTPLTSIISYGDLLAKEEGLPDHVNDYIQILLQKSERLKVLIQDLFDLAKASSGDMELETEQLNLGKLIQQTLGDVNEQVVHSGLAIRVNIPEEQIYIKSDGKKLYRVFQNLILNALKYSLVGSRVYIDLITEDKKAIVLIKNTANYEMNFDKEEILERFVRGDKARSTEGSGLGLAIAQNFTQVCGGSFNISVDGDLFKVKLSFPTISNS